MHPRCNKCRVGVPAEGDSWCTGCSGLELAQTLLGQRWQSPGVRKVAEETLVTAARLVRAFANLDRSFVGSSAGTRAESTRPAIPALPPVPERPVSRREEPRRERERSRDRTRRCRERSGERDERPPLPRREASQELYPKRGAKPPDRREEEDGDSEESEEEPVEEDREVREPIQEVKTEGGHLPPPEPRNPPRKKRSHKKKTRGGRKHQRHYREVDQPLRRSHRRLKGADVELSSSAHHALTRRI